MSSYIEPLQGKIALALTGEVHRLQVLRSAAGFYIGTCSEHGPLSRESAEYWEDEHGARAALASGEWTQRCSV